MDNAGGRSEIDTEAIDDVDVEQTPNRSRKDEPKNNKVPKPSVKLDDKDRQEESPLPRRKKDSGKTSTPISPRRKPSSTTSVTKSKKKSTTPKDSKKGGKPKRRKEVDVGVDIISDDNLYQIFSYLDGIDLITVSLVSQHWRTISEDEKLWQELFARKGWILPSSRRLKKEGSLEDVKIKKPSSYRAYYLKAHVVRVDDWQPNEENAPATKKK